MIPVLKLTPVQALAVAGVGVALGIRLRRSIPLLDRLHIPASIVGGMVFAVVALVLHDRWLNLEVDVVLRDVMLIASFTTIGLNASVRVLRKAGVQVGLLAGLAFLGAIAQGIVGVGLSTALGLDPRIGILAGVVALAGGPATSLAFGPVFERMGVTGATALALASATF